MQRVSRCRQKYGGLEEWMIQFHSFFKSKEGRKVPATIAWISYVKRLLSISRERSPRTDLVQADREHQK